MPADTLLPATTSTGPGPHKRIGFLARGNQGRYSSIVPGHWTYLYGVLAGSVKYNGRTAIPHFREPQSGAANFKRHYACGVSSPPLLRLRLRFRLRRRPRSRLPRLPSPRPSPWRDSTFAAATTPSADTGPATLRIRRVHGSDHVPRCVRFRHGPTHCVPGGRHDRKKRRGYIQGLHLRLPARTISESPAR